MKELRVDVFKVTIILFLTLLVTGLNEFLSKMAKIEGLLSPFILFLALLILILGAKRGYLGLLSYKYSLLILLPVISYLFFGSLASLGNNSSGDILAALRFYLPSLIVYFSFIIGLYHVWRKVSFNYMIQLLRVLLSINVYFTILVYFSSGLGDRFMDAVGADRLAGLFGNPNTSGFSGCILLCMEYYALKKKLSSRPLIIIQILAVFFFIFIGFSRTSAIMTFIVTLLFLRPQLKLRSMLASVRNLIIIAVVLISGFFIFFDEISLVMETQKVRVEQIEFLLKGEFSAETTGDRSELAERGLEMVDREPFWGNGLMKLKSDVGESSGVHNQYILIWGEAGIIPLIFYLAYFVIVWRSSRILQYELKVLVRSLILCTMIFSLVSHSLFYNKSVFLIYAFFSLVLIFNKYFSPGLMRNRKASTIAGMKYVTRIS